MSLDLDTMARHVCRKVRQTDDLAIAACKEFLSDRYLMICEESLWRDLIYQFNGNLAVTGTADDLNHTSFNALGYYLLPSYVDRVLAIRTPNNSMVPESSELFFSVDPDVFETTGEPVKYDIVSPRIWMFETATEFGSTSSDLSTDPGVEVTADIIGPKGRRRININVNDPNPALDGGDAAIVIERVQKAQSSGTVTVFHVSGGLTTIAELSPTQTSLSGYQTIRVLPKPRADTTLRILVKKKPLPLTEDNDVPELRGVAMPLMTFAQGDMLERARRHGMAQPKFAEALALLESLKQQNVWQEASSRRVVLNDGPASGDASFMDKSNFL